MRSAALCRGGTAPLRRRAPRRRSGVIVAAQILPVGAKVGPVTRKILLISTDIGLVALNVAPVLGTITLFGIAVVVAR
jgi:hypothetical protein